MNSFFRKISFRQKLYLFLGVVVLFLAALLFILLLNVSKVKNLSFFNDLLVELKTEFLLLDKKRSAFVSNLNNDPSFFIKGENSYLFEYRTINKNIEATFQEINTKEFAKGEGISELLLDLKSEHKLNTNHFNKHISILQKRGNADNGMLGNLNILSSQIRSKYGEKIFQNKIELLFEYQQNYLLSYNNIYLNKYNSQYREIDSLLSVYIKTNEDLDNEFNANIDSTYIDTIQLNERDSSIIFESQENDLTKRGGYLYLKRQLKKYNDNFYELDNINQEIGITEHDASRGKLVQASEKFEIIINQIFKRFDGVKIDLFNGIAMRMVLLLASIFILIGLISFLYSTYILGKLKNIDGTLAELTLGKFPEKSYVSSGNDEFDRIITKLNLMSEGMRHKLTFIKNVTKETKDTKHVLLSDHDELGKSLLTMRKNLIETKKAERILRKEENERNWVNIGLTKFAEILSKSSNELSEIGYSIIFNLIKYVDLAIGGIYYLNDIDKNDVFLELITSYAYDRRKYETKKILFGEGLVGATVKEKKTMYLTNTPDKYIELSSGLGRTTPRYLLIVPLIFEGNVMGAVEVAAFDPLPKYKIEFIEKVCESVANTFANQKISKNTSKLLEKSETQSVKMVEQETEMRQSFEEITATNETLEQKKSEWQSFWDKFDKVAFLIEYDISGKIISFNNKVLELYKMPENEFKSFNHKDLIPKRTLSDTEYKSLWAKICSGKKVKRIVTRSINKENFLMVETYLAIEDKDQRTFKIMHIAFDVSELKAIQGMK